MIIDDYDKCGKKVTVAIRIIMTYSRTQHPQAVCDDIKMIRSLLPCNQLHSREWIFSKIIGVARIFDWGGGGKACAMTSSEIFKRGNFCRTKIA